MAKQSRLAALIGERAVGVLDYYFRPGLRRRWGGGGFNGQGHRQRMFREIHERFAPAAIVETGTFRGNTTLLFAQTGLPVATAERSPRFQAFALRMLSGYPNVDLRQCDSRAFLRALASEKFHLDECVFFYLDAHWEKDLPLREELEIIFGHWRKPIVMIDDFQVPGTQYRYDDYGPGMALTLDYLKPIESLGFVAFFPSVADTEETGKTRGSVVLCRSEQAPLLEALPSLKRQT
ncbi:MAG TPA: hypothetical protein VM369_05290 [Candidatus Binatia bacterium]|nr:hypothetical protein [Candidatus Binatia bacterium]